jgi:hypothetical protein
VEENVIAEENVKPVEEVLKKYQQEYSDEDDRPSVGLTELSEAVSSPDLPGAGPAEPEDGGVETAAETEVEAETETLPVLEDDGDLEVAGAETPGHDGEASQEIESAAPPVKLVASAAAPSAEPLNLGIGWAVSARSLQMVYNAREHRTVLEYPAYGLADYNGERCLVIYIPDNVEGVRGLLPESKAGLRRGERLEDLMRDPFVRVLPERINRQEGYCVLNRTLAQEITSRRAWARLDKGSDVDAVVIGVRRRNGTPFQVVLDVEGILAVMPIAEISHSFVESVNFRRGDVVPVRILEKRERTVEADGRREVRRRLVVSKKAREFNPWQSEIQIPVVGMPYPGQITYVDPGLRYIHVKLKTGMEVLVRQPSLKYEGWDNLVIGREVIAYVTYVDRTNRRVYGTLNRREVQADIKRYAKFPPGRPAQAK